MKDFKDMLEEEEASRADVLEELDDLSELAVTSMELALIDLIEGLVEFGAINDNAFDGIYDTLEDIYDSIEEEKEAEDEDMEESEELEERAPLYKKKGMVKCPNGKIRKRGSCAKPIDKKKSRILKKAARSASSKRSRKKGAIKRGRTKRRMGQQK